MNFGKYECFSLDLGSFLLDGGAMFGIVPKTLWEKKIPADSSNRILLKGRALLVVGGGRNIIVDTGCGTKLNDKMKHIYGIHNVPRDMDEPLSHFGLTSQDITDVILTHLHFDHAGGATRNVNSRIIPSFPNAVYHVSTEQWAAAMNPTLRDQASFMPENYLPLKEAGIVHLIEHCQSPFESIDLLMSHGHTAGQLHPLVNGKNKSLFYCGDLIPTSAHVPIPWHMGYDNSPLTIMGEKELMLKRAVDEGWVLFFEHDSIVSGSTVIKGDRGPQIDRIIEL